MKRMRMGTVAGPMMITLAFFCLVLGSTAILSADDAEQRTQQVSAHIAAGEFGPAMEVARQATDPSERVRLLNLVSQAQMKQGDFQAALSTIRQMPAGNERRQAQQEHAQRRALAGGSGADFGPLIDLITNETSGPWMDLDGEGGTITEFEQGVKVNPFGVLHLLSRAEQSNRLKDLGIQTRKADLNEDMAMPSSLRMVSLTRLEREVSRRINEGQPVVESMRMLAGLQKIEYVFVYPEEGEIVIAGPAEGWQYNQFGVAVGQENEEPVLHLDDLVTVMRTFSNDGMQIFGCSINPRQEGLKNLRDYVAKSNARGPLRPSAVPFWVKQLQNQLGLQDIVIYGVPASSRVARVIVEADYRMKLIGIGRLDGGKGVDSFFDLLVETKQTNVSSMDALRWWLTMKYDAVEHSADKSSFAFSGPSVQCLSENQFVTAEGKQVPTGQAEETNRLFAQRFTENYQQLAERDSIFADLRNVFDLALVAALMHREQLPQRAGWDLGEFASHGRYQPAEFHVPEVVDSVVNHRVYHGRDVVVQVAGGVRADLMKVVNDKQLLQETPRLGDLAAKSRASQLPAGRWWWDAAK